LKLQATARNSVGAPNAHLTKSVHQKGQHFTNYLARNQINQANPVMPSIERGSFPAGYEMQKGIEVIDSIDRPHTPES
jgi:hypothetical protein